MSDFNSAVNRVLITEGGYVNHPNDKGGETNFGISKKAYPNVDIKALTREKAAAIYRQDYWLPVQADKISSQEIAESLFDAAVNMGVGTAAKLAQKTAGAIPDGKIGKDSLVAINLMNEKAFLHLFALHKLRHYATICTSNPQQKIFLHGWLNRTLEGLV